MANEVKPIPDSGFNLSSMNGILNTILSAFSVPEQPVTPLPPPLIMFGAKLRPGLSAQSIAAEIISKQSEAGRVVGDVFADGPNVEEAMEVIRVQEIVKALLNEAKIEVVIPPGVQVLTVGPGNLGAPVISQGATTSMGIGDGVIR
jgi:urease gamma subunit